VRGRSARFYRSPDCAGTLGLSSGRPGSGGRGYVTVTPIRVSSQLQSQHLRLGTTSPLAAAAGRRERWRPRPSHPSSVQLTVLPMILSPQPGRRSSPRRPRDGSFVATHHDTLRPRPPSPDLGRLSPDPKRPRRHPNPPGPDRIAPVPSRSDAMQPGTNPPDLLRLSGPALSARQVWTAY
jgi:hypothetical protein